MSSHDDCGRVLATARRDVVARWLRPGRRIDVGLLDCDEVAELGASMDAA